MNPDVNCRLWVMMTDQCRFIDGKKSMVHHSGGDVDNEEAVPG